MSDYTLPERQRVALITNELQRDYLDPESPLSTQCTRQAAREAIDLVSAFREQGLPILHGVRFFLPDGSNVEPCRRQAVEEGLRVLMPGTRGAELLPETLCASEEQLAETLLAGKYSQERWNLYAEQDDA